MKVTPEEPLRLKVTLEKWAARRKRNVDYTQPLKVGRPQYGFDAINKRSDGCV